MGDICKNKLFKENEYVVFGDPTNKRAWLLNIGFQVNKNNTVWELFGCYICGPYKEETFFKLKDITIEGTDLVKEIQTSFNYYKLVCKTDDVIANIGFGLS